MISEKHTKITSWLRNPKSLAAKISIGATLALAVFVPAVSALIVQNGPEPAQNSVVSTGNTKNLQEQPSSAQNTTANDSPTAPQSSENGGNSPAPPQNTNPGSAQQPVPEPTPTPLVLTNTYPYDTLCASGQPIQSYDIDDWGQTKCQSTSYAAWKVNEAFGNMPKYWEDANTWPTKADTASIARGTTPKLHSVGVVGNFNAFVEEVNGDNVTVSWYNWGNDRKYGTWGNVPASKFTTYIYFGN